MKRDLLSAVSISKTEQSKKVEVLVESIKKICLNDKPVESHHYGSE